MSSATTLDPTGRVVLPSAVRRQLNLAPGARLKVAVVAGRIELTPEPDAAPLARSRGRLVLAAAAGQPPVDAALAIRAERDAQARRRSSR